ncbi:zinc/manganese transport system substrate-binding protein [Faunimonas pinastri]|uniref:Zinc/manganese transport system substrate-binding protein n=1 Tax=Faunimonas pinastri TaxID=1855383 RepID=A0A1H9AIH4_9HYPH|nr:zinc ABC transporter substrate-binding protein [Faunimonas pinastri]SEP75748.1 zinc/manganese transport system substrate-binding protein [Faunimonas pinastri]
MKRILTLACAVPLLACFTGLAMAKPLQVVAAESVYGDIARQVGGSDVEVTSILSNPDQDPHLFETSPSTARALSGADVVVYNGADYDPWMDKLVAANKGRSGRAMLIVADLSGHKTGDNPHLWYEVDAVRKTAAALADAFVRLDPSHEAAFRKRAEEFDGAVEALDSRIGTMKARFAGVPVTATEPVFGYMAEELGLEMRNARFQMSVMNETEPSASDLAAFQDDLKGRKVRALIYNDQVSDQMTSSLLDLAKTSGIPVVGVTETEPSGLSYQNWMAGRLDALEQALKANPQ